LSHPSFERAAGIIKGLEEIPNEDWRDALALARKAALPMVFIGQAGFSAIPKFGNQPHTTSSSFKVQTARTTEQTVSSR